MNTQEHTAATYQIDAEGRRLGSVATEAANVLNGKKDPNYAPNQIPAVTVRIVNAAKLDVPPGKKAETYESYSGYPGGRRVERLDQLAARLGYSEVIRRTVKGMLPKNRLQKRKMLHLEVTE